MGAALERDTKELTNQMEKQQEDKSHDGKERKKEEKKKGKKKKEKKEGKRKWRVEDEPAPVLIEKNKPSKKGRGESEQGGAEGKKASSFEQSCKATLDEKANKEAAPSSCRPLPSWIQELRNKASEAEQQKHEVTQKSLLVGTTD